MSSEPIIDHVPVWKREADGAVITQFDYPGAGRCRPAQTTAPAPATVLDDAVRGVKANRGIDIDLESLPLDDKPTYDLLARGDTLGIFQFDGGPMRVRRAACGQDHSEDIWRSASSTGPAPSATTARRRR